MYTYEAETTRSIAEEMARYDEATYQQLHFVRLGSIKPINDEQEAITRCTELFGAESLDGLLIYRWRFTSVDPPTKERWASFGVKVVDV